jgi:hypothetical protein
MISRPGWGRPARGDALTRTSAGSDIHASQCSRDAALSPQSHCMCAGNDVASTIPVLFVSRVGGFCDRRRRPTTLDPATSQAPHSHVSAIWEITRERQRAGIWGGSDGPSGVSDSDIPWDYECVCGGYTAQGVLPDIQRESTPCLETGNDASSSDTDVCRERAGRTSVVDAEL